MCRKRGSIFSKIGFDSRVSGVGGVGTFGFLERKLIRPPSKASWFVDERRSRRSPKVLWPCHSVDEGLGFLFLIKRAGSGQPAKPNNRPWLSF
jgi:hypothetical protein